MKALSKPLSSPGRAEKFPPPLLRFLRSNVGSRSRGRTRSSPMFYLRSKKSAAAVIETTQEPSSPKVTCIGQVRVRRSKKSSSAANHRRCCWWVPKPLFCRRISFRFRVKKRPCSRIFWNWSSFLRFGYCKKFDATEESFRTNSNQKSENLVVEATNNSISSVASENEEIKSDFIDSSSCTPPKNALLLTRCRSAPYRSSSLGGRFWGSPLEGGVELEKESAKSKETETQSPSCENVVEESRISEEGNKELEKTENKAVVEEDLNENVAGGGSAVHPLLLTRCKSEPARTGERLIPEASFWRQRRLGAAVEPRSFFTS